MRRPTGDAEPWSMRVNKFLLTCGVQWINFSSDLRVFMNHLLVDVSAASRETETRSSGNLVCYRLQVTRIGKHN
jgi:hypothetical protein